MIQGDHLGVCSKAKLYFDTIAYHEAIITYHMTASITLTSFLIFQIYEKKSRPLINHSALFCLWLSWHLNVSSSEDLD